MKTLHYHRYEESEIILFYQLSFLFFYNSILLW